MRQAVYEALAEMIIIANCNREKYLRVAHHPLFAAGGASSGQG